MFLSIGYATCHWCHVMTHESFEDEAVAGLLPPLDGHRPSVLSNGPDGTASNRRFDQADPRRRERRLRTDQANSTSEVVSGTTTSALRRDVQWKWEHALKHEPLGSRQTPEDDEA